jgi:uncharacterized protein
MRPYAKQLRATLTVSLTLVGLAGTAVAGPPEDAEAAYKRGDYATAYRLYRPLADQEDAGAQEHLGLMYLYGLGVPVDYAAALRWFHKAANQGYVPAQYALGDIYNLGRAAPKNYAEAMKWYRRAADQGHIPAQLTLGEMYANGQGVPQDFVQAYMWYNIAASQADGLAGVRDFLAFKMTPEQIAEGQKLAAGWKPIPER